VRTLDFYRKAADDLEAFWAGHAERLFFLLRPEGASREQAIEAL
jgi:hypothetical protein